MPSQLLTISKFGGVGCGCAALFLLPFAVVGLVATGLTVWHIWLCSAAQSWTEVPCTILNVEMRHNPGDGGGSDEVKAEYQYEVNQTPYTSTRVWFGTGSDNLGSFQTRVFRELNDHKKRSAPFRCYVDPADSASAVLYREIRWEMVAFGTVFAILFGGVGIGGLLAITYFAVMSRRLIGGSATNSSEPWKENGSSNEGVYSTSSKWAGLFLFAVIWNVCSITLTMSVLRGDVLNTPSVYWLVLVFPIIGLFIAWSAWSAVARRVRFGTPTVTIRPWPLFVGDPLEGTIDFPALRPTSSDLNIELRVLPSFSLDGSFGNELYSDSLVIPNSESSNSFRFTPPDSLPRATRPSDILDSETARWELKVTGSEGPSDFEATFNLEVFERSADPKSEAEIN